MKVPVVTQTVQAEVPTIRPVQVPGAIEGAFGEREAEAMTGVGRQVAQLGELGMQYVARQRKFALESQNFQKEKLFSDDIMNGLWSKETETYKDSLGVDRQRVKGIMYQVGDETDGAYERYKETYTKRAEEIIDTVKDPEYKLKLQKALYNHFEARGNSVLSHQAEQTKVAAIGRIDTKILIDSNLFASATSDKKDEIREGVYEAIKSGLNRGYFTVAQAQKKIEDFNSTIVRTAIYNDNEISEKDSLVLAELKLGEKGDYKFLSQDERLKMIKDSQQRIFQNNQSYKRAMDKVWEVNEDSITASLTDRTKPQPTENDVIKQMNDNLIRPGFAKTVIKALQTTAELKEDRGPDFAKMVDFISNPENKPKDINEELILQSAKGNLNQEEMKILYTFNKEATIKEVDKMSPHKSGIRTIYDWSNANAGIKTVESRARMFKYYMTKVNEGMLPELAVKEAIKYEVVNLHPQLYSYPEEGQLIYDIGGNLKIIKPDGTMTNPKAKESK